MDVLITVTLSFLAAPEFLLSVFNIFRTKLLFLSSGFLNAITFPFTLLRFIGYPFSLESSRYLPTNLHAFPTTVCLLGLTIRLTSLTFVLLAPLPVSFAHLMTALPSAVHLSYGQRYFGYSAPSTSNGTLFVHMSDLQSMPVLSDPKLELTFPSYLLTYLMYPLLFVFFNP